MSNLQLTLSNKQTTKLEVSTRYSNYYDVIRVISTGICKVLLLLNDHRTPLFITKFTFPQDKQPVGKV